jgi:uncharacterized protein (DUF362 family)
MTSNRVIVCDLNHAVRNLVELSRRLGVEVERRRRVLVKPNICGLYHPSLDLLSSAIELALPDAESVVVGETKSMIHEPKEQFEKLGVTALLTRFGNRVKAVDLSDDERLEVKIPNPHALENVALPRTVFESDILINVPKVGTHSTTRLTCALKNLFGLMPHKRKYIRYHPLGMDKVIADIAQIVKPDLNIVDAGDKAILGVDALTVDIVSCRFVELDPLTVKHLRLVSEDRNRKLERVTEEIEVTEL